MHELESLFDLSHLGPPPCVLDAIPMFEGDRAPFPALSWFSARVVIGA